MSKIFTNPYDFNEKFTKFDFESREKWLKNRVKGIGASECSAIVGVNPYLNNVTLWESKVNKTLGDDNERTPEMTYGIEAEAPLRRLFELSNPRYHVFYQDNVSLRSKAHKFMLYSPDGLLYDIETDSYGIYEGKTAKINSKAMELQWENQIPQQHFIQILYGMYVTGFEYAVLNVELRKERRDEEGNVYQTFVRKDYRFERKDYIEDISYIIDNASEFWKSVRNKQQPPLVFSF